MKKLLVASTLLLALVLLPLSSANAVFGIGDCSKLSKSIKPIESRVSSDITYIKGLWLARPSVDSAQGLKLYDKYTKIESNLKRIRALALTKSKCFSAQTLSVLNDDQYWSLNYYLAVGANESRYWVMSYKEYLTLKFK